MSPIKTEMLEIMLKCRLEEKKIQKRMQDVWIKRSRLQLLHAGTLHTVCESTVPSTDRLFSHI